MARALQGAVVLPVMSLFLTWKWVSCSQTAVGRLGQTGSEEECGYRSLERWGQEAEMVSTLEASKCLLKQEIRSMEEEQAEVELEGKQRGSGGRCT